MILTLLRHAPVILATVPALFRTRRDQAIVELALRQQLAAYGHKRPRPRVTPVDRAFWVALACFWPRSREVLVIVRPETVVRWHRNGFRLYWRSIFKRGPRRPPISPEVRELIRRFVAENPWRARRIQAELEKLGFRVGLATVSRSLPKKEPDDRPRQRWKTFLRNQRDVISAVDFLVVPTVRFQLLYAWFVIQHERREILHVNVTTHPTAAWVIQQLRQTLPWDDSIRILIHDNDAIFSNQVGDWIERLGIEPKATAYRSPWQNGLAERWVGTIRRDLLDHAIVIDERRLRRLLLEYVEYYNRDRVHTGLRDSPRGRPVEGRNASGAKVIGRPRLGGLHHRYGWGQAA